MANVVINSGPILALQRLFESDLDNGRSPSHSNLVSDGIYIYSGSPTYGFLVGAISAQGLQAWLQLGVTRIVVPFCPPEFIWVRLESCPPPPPPPRPPQSCVRWSIHLFKSPIYDFLLVTISGQGPMPDFNNGLGNDFNSDVSKQIRHSTRSVHLHERNIISLDMLTSLGAISLDILTWLGQPTIRLRRYGWNTSKEGNLRRKKGGGEKE